MPSTVHTLRWQDHAACHGEPLSLFFGPDDLYESPRVKTRRERDAKELCGWCSVRGECLDWALDRDERYGIYGGLTPEERAAELRRRHRRAAA
jgi:WhiB family redox-sensing transcriptional regulator